MIPKIIHYCWFGGNPLTEMGKRCLESWKKYCPDYRIIEWNESNFDIHYNDYVSEAYANRKWAFISDVARLYALTIYGGIYMDTDVEVIRPLDSLLSYEAVSGFESETQIPTGLMACREGFPLFQEFLHDYDGIHFQRADGSLDLTTNVKRIGECCERYGLKRNNQLQTVRGFTLLPKEFLCPKDFETKTLLVTENTYVIHHFDGSWLSEEERYEGEIRAAMITKLRLPHRLAGYAAKFIAAAKFRGLPAACQDFLAWLMKKRR